MNRWHWNALTLQHSPLHVSDYDIKCDIKLGQVMRTAQMQFFPFVVTWTEISSSTQEIRRCLKSMICAQPMH